MATKFDDVKLVRRRDVAAWLVVVLTTIAILVCLELR